MLCSPPSRELIPAYARTSARPFDALARSLPLHRAARGLGDFLSARARGTRASTLLVAGTADKVGRPDNRVTRGMPHLDSIPPSKYRLYFSWEDAPLGALLQIAQPDSGSALPTLCLRTQDMADDPS